MKENFGMNPEKEMKTERPGYEKMRSYLANESIKLNNELRNMQPEVAEGDMVLVDKNFRIIPPASKYDIKDKQKVSDKLKEMHGSDSAEVVEKDENKRAGFLFEMLKTSIMHKKAGDKFIVVRSSKYDDVTGKVDNVIVDKKTGHVVCAFDECSPEGMNDDEIKKKRREILNHNFGDVDSPSGFGQNPSMEKKMGMSLKYGMKLTEGRLEAASLDNLPIFLLSLDHRHLNTAQKDFDESGSISDFEEKLFKYFLASLSMQIKELELDRKFKALPQIMQDRINMLSDYLKDIAKHS